MSQIHCHAEAPHRPRAVVRPPRLTPHAPTPFATAATHPRSLLATDPQALFIPFLPFSRAWKFHGITSLHVSPNHTRLRGGSLLGVAAAGAAGACATLTPGCRWPAHTMESEKRAGREVRRHWGRTGRHQPGTHGTPLLTRPALPAAGRRAAAKPRRSPQASPSGPARCPPQERAGGRAGGGASGEAGGKELR